MRVLFSVDFLPRRSVSTDISPIIFFVQTIEF